MRLNHIKLSGFKSFADSTQLMLPGQLVGVVGPNGCGKSNIMDAVRWVLGESRASELRGESMQDVIFNGTNIRKSASRSSVELVFDNSDHRAGGQWGQYAEIAVKRILTREGSSSYYLNNQPVRRRDVQDVFLGTGLGPRAYAIIGQGTISRIIESKPEELRLFLEEAAGVSKYKERRRETENRLSDTRENLVRVEDILRELNSQLTRLEQQAEVARSYHALNQSVITKQQQLWWLKAQDSKRVRDQIAQDISQSKNELETKVADLRHIESEIETLRQSHYAAGDEVNQAQGQLYESSAEVGRLEGEIRFLNETRLKAQSRLLSLEDQSKQWHSRLEEAKTEETELVKRQAEHQELVERLKAEIESLSDSLSMLQDSQAQAQLKSQDQNKMVIGLQQGIQVLAAEQRGVQDQLNQTLTRVQKLHEDLIQIKAPDASRMEQAQSQLSAALAQAEEARQFLEALQTSLPSLESNRQSAQTLFNQETAKGSDLLAKIEALKTLQASVLDSGRIKPWLQKHGLDGLQALWSQLQVEAGWETAVESALKERIGSYLVGRLESVQSLDKDPPPTKVVFHEIPKQNSEYNQTKLPRLIDRVNCFDSSLKALLSQWLSGAYTAENLSQAFVARSQFNLTENENIYTSQGHVVGSSTVLFYAPDHEQAGVLERNQAIENFEKQLKAQHLMREQAQQELFRAEAAYKRALEGLEQARQNTILLQKRAHDAQVESIAIAQLFDQTRLRGEQIKVDLDESQAHQSQLEDWLRELERKFESLDMQLGDQQERAHLYTEQLEQASNALLTQQNEIRQRETDFQQQSFVLTSGLNRLGELQRTQSSASAQMANIESERAQLQAELEELQENKALEALQDALSLKAQREQVLAAKRSIYDDLTSKLRASDERRLTVERALEPLRQRMSELQLKEQAARLSLEQFEEHLMDAQADLAAIELGIQQEGVQLQGLSSEIDRLGREIAALGAVNLAALDELTLAKERKTFLDAQTQDLTQAMNTLEAAIKKIDAETRDLLGSTFNSVNEHFGQMFPELFGGGNAKLVMTGEEILDSGVQVWAQPPGKKNQTIHLLSGGEKALTAIALVFAIFQLNPAPFCLLDEVDAPLDDANTERYCKLVKSMSKETQFLFISHNKIAMEMAEQLIGVTMQEQGVSRIVAVDMESAVSMVEA